VTMMATTVEALIGAVWEDIDGMEGDADALKEVEKVMQRMGFFEHPVFSAVSTSSASSLRATVHPLPFFGPYFTAGQKVEETLAGVDKAGNRKMVAMVSKREEVENTEEERVREEEVGVDIAMLTPAYHLEPPQP
jgi:hypothetical protein